MKVVGFPQRILGDWTSGKLEADRGEVARGTKYAYITGVAIGRAEKRSLGKATDVLKRT